MGKQDQIDALGGRLDGLRDFVHGSDVGDFGLDDRLSAVHDQVVSLKDEVACLRKRVEEPGKCAACRARQEGFVLTDAWDRVQPCRCDETQAEEKLGRLGVTVEEAATAIQAMRSAWANCEADETQAEPKAKPVTQARVFAALDADEDRRELAEWKARAEKAEAEVADLQAQIRGVKRVLGVPMPAENSFHKGKAA